MRAADVKRIAHDDPGSAPAEHVGEVPESPKLKMRALIWKLARKAAVSPSVIPMRMLAKSARLGVMAALCKPTTSATAPINVNAFAGFKFDLPQPDEGRAP